MFPPRRATITWLTFVVIAAASSRVDADDVRLRWRVVLPTSASLAAFDWDKDLCLVSDHPTQTRCLQLSTGKPSSAFENVRQYYSDDSRRFEQCFSAQLGDQGRQLVLGCLGSAVVWRVDGHSPLFTIPVEKKPLLFVHWNATADRLNAVSTRGTVYSAAAPDLKASLREFSPRRLAFASWSDDVHRVLYCRDAEAIWKLNLDDGVWTRCPLQLEFQPTATAIGRIDRQAVVAAASGTTAVMVYRLMDGALLRELIDHEWIVHFLRIAADRDEVISADRSMIRRTDMRSGAVVFSASFAKSRPIEVGVSPDGNQTAIVFENGTVEFWEAVRSDER